MGRCSGRKTCYIILLIVGIVLIVLPFVFHGFVQREIRKTVASNLKIKPGSQIYDQWEKPTLPVYLDLYMFSIANPSEVKQGKPPQVIEKGPYSYRETKAKINISWGDNNVTYDQITRYYFDPVTSCNTCFPKNDTITTFNIPLVSMMHLLVGLRSTPLKGLVDIFLNSFANSMFITKTVDEIVWGYKDPFFQEYTKFRETLIKIPFLGFLAKGLPEVPPIFALQPNPSFDGVSTVNTGESNVDDIGKYLEWKGMTHLTYWSSETANMLNGTDGSVYKPYITKDGQFYVFISLLCRSLVIDFLTESAIREIKTLKFHLSNSTFISGDVNPDNKGFCNPNCLPSGLLSVNACVPFNAPIVVSHPHFLNGDPILLKKVLGLHPDPEKHDTFVHIEPTTGIPLQASKKLQFNIHVQQIRGEIFTSGLTSSYFPIMWVNEHVKVDEANAEKLKKELVKLEIVEWLQRGVFILGCLLVLISLVLFLKLCLWKKKDSSKSKLDKATAEKDSATAIPMK